MIGDVDEVLGRSRPLMLDPLYGHADELLNVRSSEFRETVKELAQLDGAFVVNKQGTFMSAARYIDVEPGTTLVAGTRHASRSRCIDHGCDPCGRARGVAEPRSCASTRVAKSARNRPELFLLADGLFARDADVRQVPEAGITLAVADN